MINTFDLQALMIKYRKLKDLSSLITKLIQLFFLNFTLIDIEPQKCTLLILIEMTLNRTFFTYNK